MEGLEKMINVTIKSRKDTLSNWQTSNPVLSDGEVAVVEIPATDSTPAICLIKIGDGKTNFNTLQYMQSPAADVYAWAKKATKPEYDYSEIKNLTTMIVAGNNVTATTKDNKVTISTTQNVAKIPGTLPDIGDIEALPVWNSDEGWKRIDADALKATANTIVKRNASGQIVTAAPTANNHAANKLYVDNAATAANINWGGLGSSAGNVTPIGMAMSDFHSANRLAFGKAAGITIESSTDGGTTWVDSAIPDSEKIKLVSGLDGYHPTIGLVYPTIHSNAGRTATANDKLRITLNGSAMGVYTRVRKLLINVSTAGATGCTVLVEVARNSTPTTFQTVIDATISGWSGWNDIAFGDAPYTFGSTQSTNWGSIRLTFSMTGVSSDTYSGFLQIVNLALFGDTYWVSPSYYAKSGHLYSWDYEQNVLFPKQVRTSSVPTAENDLTNKKYVDGLVAEKQSKLTTGSGIDITDNTIKVTDNVPYIASPTTAGTQAIVRESGKWSSVNVSASLGAYTIARRGANGVLAVGTPTADNHAVTKSYMDNKVGSPTCPDGMLSLQAGKTVTGTSTQGGAVTLTTSVTGKRVTITYSDELSSLGDTSYISTAIGTITLTSGQSFTIPATAAGTGGKSPWNDEYYGLKIYALKDGVIYAGTFVVDEAQEAGGTGHYSDEKLTEAGTYTLYASAGALSTDGSYGAPFTSTTVDLTGAYGLYAFVTASGDGISMQLDDEGEHNVISLDNKIARVAVLKDNTIPVYVNSKWGSYKVSQTSSAYSIVQRSYLGRIQAATPGADSDVTTKKYVDDAIKNAITTALNTSV